jgi:hypothetical protein|tara:strand:- start:101 stop:361 length:261 start_codon:yes stop_codon:yes gene_type:complete
MSLSLSAILKSVEAQTSFDPTDSLADVDTYTGKKSAPKQPTPTGLMAGAAKKRALQGAPIPPKTTAEQVTEALVAAIKGPTEQQQA